MSDEGEPLGVVPTLIAGEGITAIHLTDADVTTIRLNDIIQGVLGRIRDEVGGRGVLEGRTATAAQ